MTDFYDLCTNLPLADYEKLVQVRAFMENKVQPIINKCWLEDRFPTELLEGFRDLEIINTTPLMAGLITQELARIDPSMATFYTIQRGLVMGTILTFGTEEQKNKWLPQLLRFEKIGCFAMTEPLVGSGAFDMRTTAYWNDGWWVLNGQKKWIGNSTYCDIAIIWARVNSTKDFDKIKAFIVPTNYSGFKVEKINDKFGLKVCQNGLITLDDVCVDPELELKGAKFQTILRQTRYLVGWEATGLQVGAYEHALAYAKKREQFGKPIASFQLIQDLLAKMLANITACQCLMFQLSQLEKVSDAQASLAKAFTTSKARETVAWGREIFGGNGMSIEYNIGRFFADAEALYSYEGTYQMQNLIIGKHITGVSAFV